jgi:hypothetical protein
MKEIKKNAVMVRFNDEIYKLIKEKASVENRTIKNTLEVIIIHNILKKNLSKIKSD